MSATIVRAEIDALVGFLPRIREVDPAEFDGELHARLARIDETARRCPAERPALMKYCFDACSPEMDRGQVLRHERNKPLGYPGDYLIIDWLLQNYIGDSGGEEWDLWFQRQDASKAVRNRRDYLSELFGTLAEASPSLSVLNLACGPCRDVCEAVRASSSKNGVLFHCIDIDQRALDYAQALADEHGVSDMLRLERRNVMRLRPTTEYSLVWCSGLFDYLDDRQATFLLRRMWQMTCGGGGSLLSATSIRATRRAS